MSFWNSTFLGAHVWLWGCLLLTIFAVGGALAYFFREILQEKYLKFRWPEKCVELCIHFPGTKRYNSYWRLIPNNSRFDIDDKIYRYDPQTQSWEGSDLLAIENKGEFGAWVGKSWRKINTDFMIRKRWGRWPQIHYEYNSPEPLDFSKYTEEGFKISGDKLNQIIKTDLWNKALDLSGQNAMLIILIVISAMNLLMTLFLIGKVMGWIK